MQYFISFLEGLLTFISPCLLPMLPVYLSYFAGKEGQNQKAILKNALAFVLGFSLVFVLLGAFAGTIGSFLAKHQTAVQWTAGSGMVVFGLQYVGVLKLPFLENNRSVAHWQPRNGFFATLLFGILFSVGWTPCVGAFLGSALMLAASEGESVKGILMLITFSAGLGIPFIASAVLLDQLKTTLDFIKKHNRWVRIFSGSLLIFVGLLTITGWMGYWMALLS